MNFNLLFSREKTINRGLNRKYYNENSNRVGKYNSILDDFNGTRFYNYFASKGKYLGRPESDRSQNGS